MARSLIRRILAGVFRPLQRLTGMIISVALRLTQPSGRPRQAGTGASAAAAPEIQQPGPAPRQDRRRHDRRARRPAPEGLDDLPQATPLPAPARAAAAARGFAAGNGYLTGLIVDRLS